MTICENIKTIILENLKSILELRNQKTQKEDGSYVSKGDLLCEELIKNFLKENHPDFFLVSEETPEENLLNIKQENILILDPIDGTENCIYKNQQHVESMLALPELNEYIITGDTFIPFESRIYGLSSSLSKEDLLQLEEGYEYRIIGCCVYNMLNVVRGAYKVFENPKGAWIWDIIPGLNLALENNLNVNVNGKEYHGELLEPNKKYRFRITNK
jgi:myo-inositol-1(or 4)-monophosphatase